MIVVSHGVVVDLAERAFLRADARREIAEMVDRQRNVGEARLAWGEQFGPPGVE